MPEVFADFARVDELPEVGTVLMLGTAVRHPELAALIGKTVLFRYPNEVEADGYIIGCKNYGETFLYGVLTSEIRDISPVR